MAQEKKTHFRTFSNSKHLASEDLLGMDYISVTIANVSVGKDLNQRKKGDVPIAYFKDRFIRPGEPLKTMILNITNMKVIEDITGSPYLEDWNNVPVEIYVDSKVRFGNEIVEGLRIRKPPKQIQKPLLDEKRMPQLIEAIKQGKTTVQFASDNFSLTDSQKARIEKAEHEKGEQDGTQNQMQPTV